MKRKSAIVTSELLSAFGLEASAAVSVFSGGHINDTFLVKSGKGNFMLQRINPFVFPRPQDIMENMLGITEFLKERITKRGGNPTRETLCPIQTDCGKYYYIDDDGEYWRCIPYIENTTAYETVSGKDMLEAAGSAFGDFQSLLADYPAETLHIIIADFHNTPVRYRQLMDAAEKDTAARLSTVLAEMKFVQDRETDCVALTTLHAMGKLPLRVTHNDTKLSNILFDNNTNCPICVIDLDTVMPGFTAFDFGDSIRAGATTAAEDEADLSKVHFDLELYTAYTRGFLRAARHEMCEDELRSLATGAKLMTLEVGMRFLADYLNDDVYFRTEYPRHNLDRARNQFQLVKEMETAMPEMERIVFQYYNS